jgi:hypothetical protein
LAWPALRHWPPTLLPVMPNILWRYLLRAQPAMLLQPRMFQAMPRMLQIMQLKLPKLQELPRNASGRYSTEAPYY